MPYQEIADTQSDATAGRQRISVSASGSDAVVRCYEKKRPGGWKAVTRLGTLRGRVGRNGVAADKREGDGCTPAGTFRLGFAFGVGPRPRTRLPWRRVTPDSFWVDDPDSPQYNQWAESPGDRRTGAERLLDFPREYACAVVIEYNTRERAPGKGSAIFLHCGERPTSGCVAVREADLLRILRWLDPSKQPEITICSLKKRRRR